MKKLCGIKPLLLGVVVLLIGLTACDPSANQEGTTHGSQPHVLPTTPDLQKKPVVQPPRPVFDFDIPADDEVPDAEHNGVVRAVAKPMLKGVSYSYNSSIVNYDDHHFLLVFRVDVGELDPVYPVTKMGLAKLDANLNQVGETRYILTGLDTAEDARVFRKGKSFWMVFNARRGSETIRSMYIAELKGIELEGDIIVDPVYLDFEGDKPQKNWTPFVHDDTIYFSYSLTPHQVLRYDEVGKKVEPVFKTDSVHLPDQWPFGDVRGGTPALLRGDEYLSFYHSNFVKNGHRWYVFGAYTFDAEPPFRLRRVAEKPIYFRDNYTSILQPNIGAVNRVIFPAGLAEMDSRILISYGDNDSQTKIVTLEGKSIDQLFQKRTKAKSHLRAFEPDANIGVSFPVEFKNLSFLDEEAVVKNIRRVVLFDAPYPYDGSILAFEGGYLMAYSATVDGVAGGPPDSLMYLVRLDRNFIQQSPSRVVRCYARSPRAPKLFQKGHHVYIAFNATRDLFFGKRSVYAGALDGLHGVGDLLIKNDILRFGYEFQQENWTPFAVNQQIYFGYSVEPHVVLNFNEKKHVVGQIAAAQPFAFNWGFGPIEGGTPAVKWHNEFLAFFQSAFTSGGHRWTVMGAYTFQTTPPFQVTRVTRKPILLRDFYTANPRPNAEKVNRSVVPSGIAIEDGIIRVSYGENEAAVKIMELDEEEFAKLLSPVS